GLAALAALRRAPADPEPALAAARGTLMHRITRLFQPRTAHASSLRGITFLIAGVTLFGATALAARQTPANPQAPIQDVDFSKIRVAYRPDPPAYPAEAKAKGITGTVVVQVEVGTDGRIESAKAVSGPEPLQATAVDYAKGWRFEPARVNGKPARARFRLTMPFRLHQDATAVHDFQFDQIQVTYRPDPPAYPAEAKAKGITGTVIVEVLVDREGRVESAKAVEGPEALRATAVDYASAWKFKPSVLDGKPVKARFRLTMPFRLH
ncbi:MAG TPA: energy transducer TonB, partial [Holophagaceae bacterium]